MKKQFIKTVKNMVNSLESELKKRNILLSDLNFNSASEMLDSIDDLLLDGGEFRCEGFADLTHNFAFNFGEIELKEFEDIKWRCIKLAYDVLKKKHEEEYMKDAFTNEEILIVADENYVLEGRVEVELKDIIDGDLESFLDLLDEKLTNGLMLQEIDYEMIKCIPQENSIIFNVSGDISDRIDEMEDECFEFIDEYIEDEYDEDDEDEDDEYEYEIALDYKGVEVYHVYTDNNPMENSPYEYHFTLEAGNCDEEFDIRELDSFDENINIIENLKLAIDRDLL